MDEIMTYYNSHAYMATSSVSKDELRRKVLDNTRYEIARSEIGRYSEARMEDVKTKMIYLTRTELFNKINGACKESILSALRTTI